MDQLIKSLQKVLSDSSSDQNNIKNDEEKYFNIFYNKFHKNGGINSSSYSVIPKIFQPLLPREDTLAMKLHQEAHSLFLQTKSENLFDNDELKAFWNLLDQHHSPPFIGEDKFINYYDYKIVRDKLGKKGRFYLTTVLFARLQQNDPEYRVSIRLIFNYVMKKVWLCQTRIGLSLYDTTGYGYLKESDLENYISDLIPTFSHLSSLEESFRNFYICTAVRKFLFFLDPLRTGKIRILDLLASGLLDELLELRAKGVPIDALEDNWFSAPSALRVYGQYLCLDMDRNGMLSKSELADYGSGTLTPIFLERVFQECLTYEGEMDYKTYLDFVLALENRHEPQALQYLFRILDVNSKGYLDAFALNYFYRSIQEQMTSKNQGHVNFQDVIDELFDMIKPKDPYKITLDDIINSGRGGTVVSILIDFEGFLSHETRE